jgi:hypothetical protein
MQGKMVEDERTTYKAMLTRQMDRENASDMHKNHRACQWCGLPGHDHDRVKRYTRHGRYHYELVCPDK